MLVVLFVAIRLFVYKFYPCLSVHVYPNLSADVNSIDINPFKTDIFSKSCVNISSYRTENTVRVRRKNQLVNTRLDIAVVASYGTNLCSS